MHFASGETVCVCERSCAVAIIFVMKNPEDWTKGGGVGRISASLQAILYSNDMGTEGTLGPRGDTDVGGSSRQSQIQSDLRLSKKSLCTNPGTIL